MTPGWHRAGPRRERGTAAAHGGQPVAREVVDERARMGVAGLGAYHFPFENSSEQVMKDTLAGLARGLDDA